MNSRLFIIEGLPCSGKSTTAEFVADELGKKYIVKNVDEGSGNHPADFEFHAFVSEHNMKNFTSEEQEEIKSGSLPKENGFIVPLSNFDGEILSRLIKYKIYDFLPWKIEMPLMLEKWQQFCRECEQDTVYIFNCVLLQNPMCETIMRFGFSEEQSLNYISEIAEIIRPMNPSVIYLKNDDIAECVKRTSAEREGWLEGVISYHTDGAYGRSINAKGFEGYIECLEERQRRELRILPQLPLRSIIIENAHRDRAAAYEKIRKFLS